MEELKQIGERLQIYLRHKKIGLNQLGRLTNTSGAQISNILKGKKYGLDKIFALLNALSDLNPNWLLLGEGEMLKGDESSKSEADNVHTENSFLKKEIENLHAMLKMQEMTINAYKRTAEMASSSVEDLKSMVEFYKGKSEGKSSQKSA